jgi:hypothetical protein
MSKTYIIAAHDDSELAAIANNSYTKVLLAAYLMRKNGEDIFKVDAELQKMSTEHVYNLIKEMINYEQGGTVITGKISGNNIHLPAPKYKPSTIEASLEAKCKAA